LAFACFIGALAVPAAAQTVAPDVAAGMRWRLVGPFRGGRTIAATGVRGQPNRFYFGAVGGGVWRTDNAGRTWQPLFDGQPIASIGAIAVAPSDSNVIYVGSGEADMRSDISFGNGMYKSVDAGKTWTRIGLSDTRQIGRILVDPNDTSLVFVAALGHAYGPNEERGVFRSKDGGKTWAKVLYKNADTGAIDLAFDPADGKTILAALWQTRRPPWNVYPPSNGAGSGLYRSADGGDTWTQVTQGFPSEKVGRIRLAFAPSLRRRVYAIVDAKEGGLYVSDDAGLTWKRASSDKRIWERGWYFGGITVDPKDADVVFACSVSLYRSTDGGNTFLPFKGAPGGDDYHRLWIDPDDSLRMIVASDQGAVVTVDGGKTWSSWYNQPTAQFYHVATDNRFPYWIYGAQQDSGAAAVPVRTDYRTITQRDWNEVSAGGESGYIVPDPKDPNIVWGGTVGRFDWRTLQDADLDPTLAYPGEYRSEWTLPLAISPRDGKTLYFGRQMLFRSTDGGAHWEKASPDLTRESPAMPATLDPMTAEDSSVKGPRRGVIYAIAPSPVTDGRIWCGTDDGQIWLTRDDGKNWKNVTPEDLPAWSKVGIIEASHFDAETAYVAIDRHRVDDLSPIILRTRDGGRSWARVARGIPDGSFANVVREDPARRGLLYAGTETGVFVSYDDGESWRTLQLNLPSCSIRDLDVRHGDLVAATHGRSFWVLDDVSPLRQFDAVAKATELALMTPRAALRLNAAPFQGTPEPKDEPMAENPPSGALIDYVVRSEVSGPLAIAILDAKGELVRRYTSDDERTNVDLQQIQVSEDWVPVAEPPSAGTGMHRFVWDLHYALPKELVRLGRNESGPWAPPGRYTVRLTHGGKSVTQPLVVAKDPRLPASITDADLARQFTLSREVLAERLRVTAALDRAASLRKRIAAAKSTKELEALSKLIDVVAGPPILPGEEFDTREASPTSLKRLASSLSSLQRVIESADMAPTADMVTGFNERKKLDASGLADWEAVLASAASGGLTPD
jgi:photosystem II stability/assembly factor-like uncharacterized protein